MRAEHGKTTAHEILASSRWHRLRTAAEEALAQGRLTLDGLRAVDRWLGFRETAGLQGPACSADVEAGNTRSTTRETVRRLRAALEALDPLDDDLDGMREVERQRDRAMRERLYGPAPARRGTRTVSLPTDQLPASWQTALADMRLGRRRGSKAPAGDIITSIEQRLGWLAWSCRQSGAAITLNRDATRHLVEDMLARGVRNRTVMGTLSFLGRFGRYLELDVGLLQDLAEEERYWEHEFNRDIKLKDAFLARSGLQLMHLASRARELFGEAGSYRSRRDWIAKLNAAALIAVELGRPLRRKDVTRLRIGYEILRDSDGWYLDFRSAKTLVEIDGSLPTAVTPYLDVLVLEDAGPDGLWQRYDALVGKRLFRRSNAAGYSEKWATQVFCREFGAGVHIVRTLLHGYAAGFGEGGVMQALALAGQRSPKTAIEYQTTAARKTAVDRGQDAMAALLDKALQRSG